MNPHPANDNRYGYCGYHNICGSQMVGVSSHKWNNLSTLMSPGQALYCVHHPAVLHKMPHQKVFLCLSAQVKLKAHQLSTQLSGTSPIQYSGAFSLF
jgi:hypothetical protein